MTSINDSLSPDLLFNIFKRLDCIQTTIIRRVCKDWFEIIEVHKSFWRTLHLPRESVEWDATILELFDHKSGSTLQDVGIRVLVEDELLQAQFFDTLKKSEKSLEHLLVNFPWYVKSHFQKPDLLDVFPHVESLVILHWHKHCKVRLRRGRSQDDQEAASPLKVLWYNSNETILQKDSSRFQNLVSLDAGDRLSPSEWRRFLEGPSQTLKHLRFGFRNLEDENQDRIPSLIFPRLEVLELDSGGDYPQWVKIKSSVKLICHGSVSNLPSISELWITELDWLFSVAYRCPELKTIKVFESGYANDDLGSLVMMLNLRSEKVKAGTEVDGIQMEMIKTLILPFSLKTSKLSNEVSEVLQKLKKLVENVIDGDSVPEIIDIEY